MSNRLLLPPSRVIQALIVQLGEGSDFAANAPWPVYADNEPDGPDNCLTVYDTAPQDDGRSMIDGETWHHYGIQVRVRSVDKVTGWLKAESLHVTLDELVNRVDVTLEGHRYLVYCINRTVLLHLGRDAPRTKRTLHTLNFVTPVDMVQ